MIATLTDVIGGDKVPRFVVSQINPDKSIELVTTTETPNITKFANQANYCLLGKPWDTQKNFEFR